jgi:hypothetical protein
MPDMPDAVYVTMITQVPLRTREGLERLLDAFESIEELAPTNWGRDERARDPYDRAALITEVSALKSESYMPGLHRRKPPRYQAYFTASDSGLKMVKVEFGSSLRKKDMALVFKLGSILANALEPEYGFVHAVWRDQDEKGLYSISNVVTARKLQECGLLRPPARTWYGAHIVKLIGRDRLDETGVPIKETPWGGVELNLVADPWEADFETLNARQEKVMSVLEPAGVFGDYSSWHDCKPGPKWKPIPEEK